MTLFMDYKCGTSLKNNYKNAFPTFRKLGRGIISTFLFNQFPPLLRFLKMRTNSHLAFYLQCYFSKAGLRSSSGVSSTLITFLS